MVAVMNLKILACRFHNMFYFPFKAQPPATTAVPPGNCSNPKAIPNGDYCYIAVVNHVRSWPEASYACQKNGMQLASVHSKAEMDFISTLISQANVTDPTNKPNTWLGLSKGAQGKIRVTFM